MARRAAGPVIQRMSAARGGPGRHSRAADLRDLEVMDLRDSGGLSAGGIAARIPGLTRGAVCGIWRRIDASADDACACTKPENRDGGMARRWWAE